MNKIAIFVEGLTERHFLRYMLYYRYAALHVSINEISLRQKRYLTLNDHDDTQGIDYYFLLVEVPSYENVLTMVTENSENLLSKHGYHKVIGLRDLSPNKRSEKLEVIRDITAVLKTIPEYDRVAIILAVMETEAWFLCDFGLFERIDSRLCVDYILKHVGVDLVNDDPELTIDRPAKTIDTMLRLVGKRYRKHIGEVEQIVRAIDYSYLCSCTHKINSFFKLLRELNARGDTQSIAEADGGCIYNCQFEDKLKIGEVFQPM